MCVHVCMEIAVSMGWAQGHARTGVPGEHRDGVHGSPPMHLLWARHCPRRWQKEDPCGCRPDSQPFRVKTATDQVIMCEACGRRAPGKM